jgi:DNA (cytosine-5)-methyltransferase 1
MADADSREYCGVDDSKRMGCVDRQDAREASEREWARPLSMHRGEAFPVYPDVRTFDAAAWRGKVDIVSGGFPCQPHSQAGKRLGGLDDRDLWPDTVRILRESGAPLGLFENVPGLLTSRDADRLPMFGRILGDLSESGFDAEWCVLGADDVGAPHRRKRLWILAYRRDELPDAHGRRREQREPGLGPVPEPHPRSPWRIDPADGGHADELLCERQRGDPRGRPDGTAPAPDTGLPLPELDCVAHGLAGGLGACVPRVAAGVPDRVPRLRALGNGQVPLAMAVAWTLLARRAGI